MTIGNFQSARVATSHRELGDDWVEHMFGPDVHDTSEPAGKANTAAMPPVLARIPDVTAASRTPRSANLLTESAAVRVDPPTARVPASRHNEADRSRLCDGAVTRQRSSTRSDVQMRRPPAKSSVLPSGNPFEIPRERLQDRFQENFAPVVRFLLLFVLFTAAGTSVMMIGKSPGTPAIEQSKPSVATIDPAIAVPTASEKTSRTRPTLDSMMTPVTAGSSNRVAETAPAMARSEARLTPYVELPETAASEVDEQLPEAPSAETNPSPYPTTQFSPARLPSAGEGPFPQVRTTDAPATARLEGVRKATSR